MNKEMRARRDTAIVTSRLAGKSVAAVRREHCVSARTIQRVMNQWREGKFKLCPEMSVRIGLALRTLILGLDEFDATVDSAKPDELIGLITSAALPDYLHVLRDLGAETPWIPKIPDQDWPREINFGIREALGEHQVSEEAIDAATKAVLEWYDEKTDWMMPDAKPPWR